MQVLNNAQKIYLILAFNQHCMFQARENTMPHVPSFVTVLLAIKNLLNNNYSLLKSLWNSGFGYFVKLIRSEFFFKGLSEFKVHPSTSPPSLSYKLVDVDLMVLCPLSCLLPCFLRFLATGLVAYMTFPAPGLFIYTPSLDLGIDLTEYGHFT